MRVANHPNQEMIHATLWLDMSDLPAARKSGGFKSHSSTEFMCTFCTQSFYSLITPDAFIPESKSLLRMGNLGLGCISRCHKFYCRLDFVPRNDWRYLKYAFLHPEHPPNRMQNSPRKYLIGRAFNSHRSTSFRDSCRLRVRPLITCMGCTSVRFRRYANMI